MDIVKFLLERTAKPRRGLLALEWVMLAYLAFTLLLMLFTYTKLANPYTMFWGRAQIVLMTLALWAVYRLLPCRLTLTLRVAAQLLQLSWWYPDTYEFNRLLPNLDHIFAQAEQTLLGCQPSLTFAATCCHPVFSELMHLGYFSYFPMIVVVLLYYLFCRYENFERSSFVVLASFFTYYVIYILLPVTGPQYYYLAAGTDQIAKGVFPNVGSYFATHQEPLPLPGWSDGFFYQAIIDIHMAGERPTAAFPSSHVGISTIIMLLAWKAKCRWLLYLLTPIYVLLCLSTVYIQAHYVVDVIGGWISGILFYLIYYYASHRMKA